MVPPTEGLSLDQLKAKIWEAVEQHLPVENLAEMANRPITPLDIYHLWERWGTLKMWDAFNLDSPGEKHLLTLEGTSKHYHVYDRGSCLMMAPVDLFSYERTLEDGLNTARAMMKWAHNKGWAVELVGYDKFVRAAWVEAQILNNQYGKRLEIINFNPTDGDIKLYEMQTARVQSTHRMGEF